MTFNGKRLSSAEADTLVRLANRGGVWSTGHRPLWESRYWTVHLLNMLARRGLVAELEADRRYEISRDGLSLVSRY